MPFNNPSSLQAALNGTSPYGPLNPGDIVRADPNVNDYDLSGITLPLIIPPGVILEGNYDPITNPGGTHIFTTTRVDYSSGTEAMHMFVMADGNQGFPTTIRKLNISGPCWSWQDFNAGAIPSDPKLRSGICLKKIQSGTTGRFYLIEDCELWGFSMDGIWSLGQTEDITINRCYFHHIKGISSKGIGYGIWFQSASLGITAENLVVTNCIFDECKSAIDGQGYKYEWEIADCSFSQYMFKDDINGHNSTVNISHLLYSNAATTCQFFDNSVDNGPVYTIKTMNYDIKDVGGWRTSIQHSIFHRKVMVSNANESNSNINIPYPNTNTSNALVAIQNNTFTTPFYPATLFNRNNGGFSKIADNCINACVWDADASFIFSTPNTYNYQSNTTISSSGVPQPPVFDFQLQDVNGNALAQNANGVSIIDLNNNPSGQFKVQLNSGAANQNLRFYLRPNPSKGAITIASTISQSTQNFFFQDQQTNMLSSSFLMPYRYEDNNTASLPGLFGMDVLGFHTNSQNTTNTYWSQLHCSDWRYQPLIVVPKASTVSPNYIESQLVFNIKDSYQEFNNPGLTPTGMLKQVRLNDQIIWQEDIAVGGDGWERISIPFSVLHPLLNINGNNTLSFHIASVSGTPIPNSTVKGLIVWVDDIYLNKFNDATGYNLITDGSVECAAGNGSCNWNISNYYNTGCVTAIAPPAGNDEDFTYYPDGSKYVNSSPISSKADYSNTDRKSGQYAIELVLPDLPTTCTIQTYNPPTNHKFITASTQFVLNTPFCENYSNPLVNNGALNINYNGNYDLNNDFVVQNGQNIIFQSCSLAVAAGKAIRVKAGAILTIYNSTLFSCSDMWQGIINEGGVVNIDQGTNIRDAIEAVRSDNGYKVIINSTNFSNNYISISLNNGNYSSSEIKANFFNLPSATSQVLKQPYANERTFAGIALSNVSHLTVGNLTAGNNNFHYAKYGVYSLNSDVVFHRNLFKYIQAAPDHCNECGVGVYSEVNDGMVHTMEFSGGTGSTDQNNFNTDINHGIISRGSMNLSVLDCIFNGSYQNGIKLIKSANSNILIQGCLFENMKEKGINIQNAGNSQIAIHNNEFNNVITGISAQDFSSCLIEIGDNDFDNSLVTDVTNYDFHNTAMTMSSYIDERDEANTVYIWNNSINDCRIGIHANNVNGLNIGLNPSGNQISNTINFHETVATQPGIYYEGIWLQNLNRPIVAANHITNSTAFGNAPEFRGLDFQSVTNGRINCNQILNMNRCMNFMGICKGTLLRANNMTGYQEAINLDGASMSPQFQINDITGDQEPMDNVWNDSPNNQGAITDRVTGNGIQFNWYYQQGASTGNVFNPLDNGTTSQLIFIQSDISNGVLCTDYTDRQMRDVKFGAVVGDSLQFNEFVDENTYLSKKEAYEAMIMDSTILNQNLPSDIAYQNFFNTISSSNIGSFNRIDSLAGDSTMIGTALLMNNAINDTNSIEYYKKEVNRLSIEKVSQDIALSLTDSLFLLNITNMQIPIAGEALFESAAILCKEVHPTYIPLRLMGSIQTAEIPDSSFFTIYPNPATAQLNIVGPVQNIKKIEINSIQGELVKKFTEFKSPIDISDLQNGNYQLSIFLFNGEVLNHKLSIVK